MSETGHQHLHHAPDATVGGDTGFLQNLFESFTPRRQCMNFETDVIWLHLVSDFLIAVAYFSIPIALIYFVRRRRDLEFNWMFLMFAAFILACGTTHLFGVWAIWNPLYRLDGLVKAATAGVSLTTAILLWPLIPKALAVPSPAQLREANEKLEREILERRAAQEKLSVARDELEKRVLERTSELETTNQALQVEMKNRESAVKDREALLKREQQALTEAQNANRVKDEFLATLSHELRTPLNAILGWSQLLAKPNIDPETNIQGLATIERSVRAQTRMIDDLLDMSRIIAGKIRLEARLLSPHEVVAAAVEAIRPTAETKGVRLQAVLDPSAGPIMGDVSRLQQVVWNLLSNAIKFTPKGGIVQIHLDRADSEVELTVSDTGEGIKPEFLPYVFERFHQADSSTSRRYGGLGLGLSIVKHLVELHGGTIRAKSPGEGKGATFIVSLPVASVREIERTAPPPPIPPRFDYSLPTLQGIRVLVVEDEPDSRTLIERVLMERSAAVKVAASAREAMEHCQTFNPDVIVCDIGLPELDGYALLEKLRSLPADHACRAPAIALTAFARPEDRKRAFVAGFQVHLAKPVDPDELVAVIAGLTRRDAWPDQPKPS